eukprot:8462353-Alexandrium_andersonii.AAC.1
MALVLMCTNLSILLPLPTESAKRGTDAFKGTLGASAARFSTKLRIWPKQCLERARKSESEALASGTQNGL